MPNTIRNACGLLLSSPKRWHLYESNRYQQVIALKKSLFWFLLVFALWPRHAVAQNTDLILFGDSTTIGIDDKVFSITGVIRQAEDKKPLKGVALFVDGLKYGNNSDAEGRYILNLTPGTYKITARHVGKQPVVLRIGLYKNALYNFEMIERAETLEEVVISAKKPEDNYREVTTGLVKLNISEIKRLPAFMGEVDVIKSLQLLPGVTSVGEGSAGFNVRGGRVDQNLIMMDGAQIFNSTHALGLLSNFNPDVVEDFALYKGNVPAQLGGRVSSVLELRTRNGDMEKFRAKAGVGFLSTRLAVEGPIVKEKTSFLIASRLSYSDWMLKAVQNTEVRKSSASFYDVNANLTHKFNQKHSFSLLYYRGHDYFRYSDQFGYDYTTQLATLRFKDILSDHWSSTTSATAGDYDSKLYDYDIANARQLENGIRYYQFKQNFLFTTQEKHAMNVGLDANQNAGKPEISSPFGDRSTTVRQRVEKDKGQELGVYVNEEYTISNSFSLSGGLRYSYYRNVGPDTVFTYASGQVRSINTIVDTTYYSNNQVIKTYGGLEPRISMRLALSPQASVKVSYNKMRQYIHLISNGTTPSPVDIWQVSNPYIKPQVGDNYSLGYFRNSASGMFEMSAETFYKLTANMVDYKDFAHLLLNNHLETELLQGQGKSYGLELFLKKITGEWTGWISYTFSRSLLQVNGADATEKVNQGRWYPSNYDKPHNLAITANHKVGRQMRFSTNFIFSSGRPATAITTNYPAGSISVPVYSDRNQYRIPAYVRLDLSITLNDVIHKIDDNLTLSIYNFLGRRNAYSIFYQQPFGSTTPQAYKLAIIGSALPSLTYNITIK